MKIGVQGGYLVDNRKNFTNDQNLTFRVNNGVPNQITQTALPFQVRQRVRYDAVYAQEQWTRGRMTLQGALRFDRASSWFPEQPFGPSNWVPFSTTFERQEGVDSYLTLSPRAGLAYDVMGDGNTGKTTQDNCAVRAVLPELVTAGGVNPVVSPTNPFCRNSPGFVTRVTGLGTYLVPRVDMMVAGTFRSDQGAPLRAIWNAPNAVVEPVLGRPLAGNAPNVAVDLIAPGDVWGDRVNELDLRFAKVLRFGRIRTHGGVDIFNILNANAVLTYSHR